MKLELSQSLQQQQVLAPQMILSMDILLLPSLDLEQRVREEFAENPALEMVEPEAPSGPSSIGPSESAPDDAVQYARLDKLSDVPSSYWTDVPRGRASPEETDTKHEALQNTAGRPPGLRESLTEQVHLRPLEARLREAAEEIIQNLDHRGYLLCAVDELRSSMAVDAADFDEALSVVRSLDPPGVGAEDLRECLLLQLERDRQEYPLEREIIEQHLADLGLNKIPKIAKDLERTVDEIKDAVEIISSLDPIPGGRMETEPTIYIRPDVVVEVIDDEIRVRVEDGDLPGLKISEACREVLRSHKRNREVTKFLREKMDKAQWLMQAIQQRQRTLQDIAVALVDHQREFMLHGPERLKTLKMQDLADTVGVHISTISRAIKGKHMQTPHGLFEMRYFFTGGVGTEDGALESRRNVYRKIEELIENEDKSRPLSDTQIAHELRTQGLQIARRTVTKYREQQGIPSSRLRREY